MQRLHQGSSRYVRKNVVERAQTLANRRSIHERHGRSELDEFQLDSEALFQIIKDLNLQWNFFAANNRIRQRSGGEKGLEDNHRLGWGNAETHCGVGTNRARLPLGDRVGNLK